MSGASGRGGEIRQVKNGLTRTLLLVSLEVNLLEPIRVVDEPASRSDGERSWSTRHFDCYFARPAR